MKAIIFLATLLIASQALTFQEEWAKTQALTHYNSFMTQLKLSPAHVKDSQACVSAVTELRTELARLNTLDFGKLAIAGSKTVAILSKKVAPACKKIFEDVLGDIKAKNPKKGYVEIVENNLEKHYPQAIQVAFQLAHAIESGNATASGIYEAAMVQILFGLGTPNAMAVRNARANRLITNDNLKQLFATLNTNVLKGLGFTSERDLKKATQCLVTRKGVNRILSTLVKEISNAKNNFDVLIALEKSGDNVLDVLLECKVNWKFIAPVVARFEKNPVAFVKTLINNVGTNFFGLTTAFFQTVEYLEAENVNKATKSIKQMIEVTAKNLPQ